MDVDSSSYPIFVGVWTNWSYGRVSGSTLTISKSDGALLIASVAFFVAVVGTQLWRILCFILHGLLSEDKPKDALHHQRQVILRNSASPAGCFMSLLKLAYAWRMSSVGSRPLRRLLPLLFGTILIAVALLVASGMSSRMAQGSDALIDGTNCGFVDPDKFNLSDAVLVWDAYDSRRIEAASDYAQRCYESHSDERDCSAFVRPALPISVTANASCPFDSSICLSQDANLILDTGLMDSHFDLGLNSPPVSRFKLRFKMHCAPLVTEGYKSTYVLGNSTYLRYLYGDASTENSDCNCSFAVNMDAAKQRANSLTTPFVEPFQDYHLGSLYASFSHGSVLEDDSVFQPIPQLGNLNGDLDIVILYPNEVQFPEASPDIWYRATTPTEKLFLAPDELGGDTTLGLFRGDEPAWPMGCMAQYEACKDGNCTGLGSAHDTYAKLWMDLNAVPSFYGQGWYIGLATYTSNIIFDLGKKALASRYMLSNGLQNGLKPNSWHKDVTHWFSTSLATLQFHLAEISRGPSADVLETLGDFVLQPDASERQRVCHSQKVRTTAYTSFSMFGLFFVFVTGTIIILISATMERLADIFQRRLMPRSSGYARLEWRTNNALQLHRLAHEELGVEDWSLGPWEIPITRIATDLAVLKRSESNSLAYLRVNSNISTTSTLGGEKSEVHEDDKCEANAAKTPALSIEVSPIMDHKPSQAPPEKREAKNSLDKDCLV
ncbi:hypothetical protein HJFPF1_10585 [Paramyrothecium foliicola]|nr:hypothetical protein HJFPF1_10585 [Paramyrothecium foliicola]